MLCVFGPLWWLLFLSLSPRRREEAKRREDSLFGFFRIWFLAGTLGLAWTAAAEDRPSNCVACHVALSERLSGSVERWKKSDHALANIGCADCHGGDPAAPRGGKAHAAFPGHPAAGEIAGFCGQCHPDARTVYETSGHAKMRGSKPANHCVDCHGAHDVGNPPELFRISEYCGSCHGVEYLPALPPQLLKLMEAGDRLTIALKRRLSGPIPAADAVEAKRLQRAAGTLVHRGSLEVPLADVQDWIAQMDALTQRLTGK